MGRKPKRNRTWAKSLGRQAVAAETSDDSEECDVPSDSVEPSWLGSYLAVYAQNQEEELKRNELLLRQRVQWRRGGGFANRVFDRDHQGNLFEVAWDDLTCRWVPLPSQWSEEAKADAIITRNRSGNWCNLSRKTRQSMPMGGGMPDGALDSNPHGEDATPNRAQPRRVRTYSRHGNRRPKDFDRTMEYDKRNKKRFDARAKEKEALLSGMYDAAKHGMDQESWVRAMMKKQLPLKQGKAFVPRPRRLRAVSAETHDDSDAGGDESEEPDNHFDDATEAGGQESRSGRHDPAACDRRTAEEFKHLIECSEGLATNCAHCNRRLDKATWKERLVSREDYPFGAYCTAACSQLHFVMRHPPARSRYDEVTPPCAVSFKPNNMCPCLRDDGESALAAHGTVRTRILSSRGSLSFDVCDVDVFYCCMCEKLFVPDEQDLACQGAIVLCSRSRRDDNDRFAIPGFPVASAIARWNIGWVEDTSTVLVELALLFHLMFSRFGPAHAGIKGFVASEQLAVEDLHGATSTGVISGDMRKHLHQALLGVTTGYMLASKQADGTLERKWCKCPLCPKLFAVSIDGTTACSTTKSGNLRHLYTDEALAPLDPNQYPSDSLLTSDAQLHDAIHSDPRALARVTAGPCATVRFEANGGTEPSVEELRALNLETLRKQPTRLAFLASCDHRVVFKCVLSQIHECQALVSLVLQSILGHPSYEPFPAGGPLEKKRTNITYDLGCQCGAVEERIAVSAECAQIREKHGEPLSTMLQNMTLSDLASRLAENYTGLGPVLEAKLQKKGAPVAETTASLLAMHPALASDSRAVRDIYEDMCPAVNIAMTSGKSAGRRHVATWYIWHKNHRALVPPTHFPAGGSTRARRSRPATCESGACRCGRS